jgi:hypothetical protein
LPGRPLRPPMVPSMNLYLNLGRPAERAVLVSGQMQTTPMVRWDRLQSLARRLADQNLQKGAIVCERWVSER